MAEKRTVLVLNSAQGKYPVGNDAWIQATVRAVRELARHPFTIICSEKPAPWDLVTYLAARYGMTVRLIVMADDTRTGHRTCDRLAEDFALDRNKTTPLYLGTGSVSQPKKNWRLRDRRALEETDLIYPVSIRPDGKLARLLESASFRDKIRDDFRIPWRAYGETGCLPAYNLLGRPTTPFPPGSWLIHWTRSSPGPWPGEKARDFYRDLLKDAGHYVRSAERTLGRILTERTVRGTSWRVSGGGTVVSLTTLSAEETIPLIRWRKRFVRYSFEPYGFAVRLAAAVALGAREVEYVTASGVYPSERIFQHSPGIRGDWTREKEWRIRGDFDLGCLARDDFFAIVPTRADRERLRSIGGLETIRYHVLFSDSVVT